MIKAMNINPFKKMWQTGISYPQWFIRCPHGYYCNHSSTESHLWNCLHTNLHETINVITYMYTGNTDSYTKSVH